MSGITCRIFTQNTAMIRLPLMLDGNLIAGEFPHKQTKYVVAWADIHRDELVALWDIMQTDEEYFKIKGLE